MQNKPEQFYHNSLARKEERIDWQNLFGSSIGLALSLILGDSSVLLITPDVLTSLRLKQELLFFLGKKGEKLRIELFPGWETLPYDHFSPHEDVISERLSLLYSLSSSKNTVVLVDAKTLMQRLPPKNYIETNSFIIKRGEYIDTNILRCKFKNQGYNCVNKVMEHGEFAIRGSIIDIFPMGSQVPYRLDFFDTDVDSIRIFDVDTQRSLKTIDDINLLPAKEFPLDEDGIEKFSASWISYFGYKKTRSNIYQDISSGKTHPGIEYYLPFFFANTQTLFDYLPSNTTVISINDVEKSMEGFWQEVENRYEQLRHDVNRPILAPQDIFISQHKILERIESFSQKCHPRMFLSGIQKNTATMSSPLCSLAMITKKPFANKCLTEMRDIIRDLPKAKILFVAKTAGRKEAMLDLLQEVDLTPKSVGSWQEFISSADKKLSITIAKIDEPLHVIFKKTNLEVLIVTEQQIFGEKTLEQDKSTASPQKIEAIIQDLTELQINDPIVHIDYGVGRYLGLKKLRVDDREDEFLEIEYAGEAKLYVPITSLNLVSRYTGIDRGHVPLNHLGSTKQWEKTKRQAKDKIRDTAVELLEICARRLNTKGFAFVKPKEEYERFASDFPFVITKDQERAIKDVLDDMTIGRLMDRLICGDVGFGKTEVAMRATFLAAYNGKQVAILTPTTLLAKQHFTNFEERFSSWPIKIALLSRFASTKEQKNILEKLSTGKIDIVIGTHKLLQKNVKFNNLGLLIVDEEHRFGVRQKEYIKKLTMNVDVLTLTATPIPRTLNMAFAGIRDFSIISTPPARRLTIKTFRCEYEPYLIKEAILRETFRGGQIYFLHNNITTIKKMADKLKCLVPDVHIAIAHGQMRKKELEQIMNDFYHLKINLLICTTIIESGIDVPSANTIIINRADKFGLAELHQLRGRVGRSHHQAYAYLITPPFSALARDAKKRLDAIVAMKDLGTGFVLATNDLEIRGAGEILGEKQSGVMQGIGFSLYMDLLKSAIRTLKGDKGAELKESPKIKTEIDLKISALIPDQYISDVNLRLVLYKRIAEAKNRSELDDLQVEMIDRFGLLPEQTKNLFKVTDLKLKAERLDITKITFGVKKGIIEFKPGYNGDINVIIPLMQKYVTGYKFSGSNSIEFTIDKEISRFDLADSLLTEWISL